MKLEKLNELLKDKKFWLFVFSIAAIAFLLITTLTPPKKETEKTNALDVGDLKAAKASLLVSRVEPLPKQEGVSTAPTINIFFDRPVKDMDVKVGTKPDFKFRSELSPGTTVAVVTPEETLLQGTKYTISVKLDNKLIYEWYFTTGSSKTPTGVVQKIKEKLPYTGNHFKITYWPSTDKFFITIDNKPMDVYRDAALNWLRSYGLTDPEKQIHIVYLPVGKAVEEP
ncbi:MAG: hypothetical protein A2172_00790 [Candidatus Woykebacteria bacterium RBG_13_40_15]|uniref:SbsA Ig-like domain-containing protein n=1 Tax=Candidatus Woykebacteria bacterium RBG_13_40_15 TaxID=1802593 RepID=A0A1G1W9Q7_9BACT|nr:MAG: hypothetical protein A2172_00790 [Candidatus Woykebacteria bacterium RBG_13_40_15]